MRHDVYPLRYNSATPDNDEALKSSWTQATSVKKILFPNLAIKLNLFFTFAIFARDY
jgi:hypothetical protein